MSEERHVRSIIIGKADCVAAAFPALASKATEVKNKAVALDDRLQNNLEVESEAIHEVLHEVQEGLVDMCDNSASKTEAEVDESLGEMIEDMDEYA